MTIRKPSCTMHHEKPEFESQPDPVLNTVIVLKCVKKTRKKSKKKYCRINDGSLHDVINLISYIDLMHEVVGLMNEVVDLMHELMTFNFVKKYIKKI